MSGNDLLTARQLSERTGYKTSTIWKYAAFGRIPCIRLGNGRLRFDLRTVKKALVRTKDETPA